jgi:hypothetical protein
VILRALTAALVFSAMTTAPGPARAQPAARAKGDATPLVGFSGERELRLVRVDPRLLRPLRGRGIAVGSGGCAPRAGGSACWAVPPWARLGDGTLAVADNDGYDSRAVRLIDLESMRTRAVLSVDGGSIGALEWFGPNRLLAVQEICCAERERLLVLDIASGRVVDRIRLGGTVVGLARTPTALALLIAPAERIGVARLVVADPAGRLRSVRLRHVVAGTKLLPGEGHRVEQRLPALSTDGAGARAFVIDRDRVAVVDLKRLAIGYHDARPGSRSPASLRRHEKTSTGYRRMSEWLGHGLLAVSGSDTKARETEPSGLVFIDTRRWRVRAVDDEVDSFVVAGNRLLATGSSRDASGIATASGLAVYDFGGTRRFRLFDGRLAWVTQAYGDRAFVGVTRPDGRQESLRALDLVAGTASVRRGSVPWLVAGDRSGWWGSS